MHVSYFLIEHDGNLFFRNKPERGYATINYFLNCLVDVCAVNGC